MPIHRIKLDGGTNDIANKEILKDNQLSNSQNYEIIGDGNLEKRKEPEEYGNHVSGNSLNTVIEEVFASGGVQQISPPMYPIRKLSDMTGDYVMLVYGNAMPGYKLYLFYETSTTFAAEIIEIDEIEYDSDTYLEFTIGTDSIIITQSDVNNNNNLPHYVKIDAEGELKSGKLGIPAPLNKPTVTPVEEYKATEYEEVETDSRLGDCGLFQMLYTVETEDGDESNPSPISNTRNMQFFKLDTTDYADERWIKKVIVSNLRIPDVTGDILDRLKYFNLYYRIIRFAAGESATPFYFSEQVEIVDKTSADNTVTVLVEHDITLPVSYENDISPIAKYSAKTAGIIGVANTREKLNLPFEFKYYCKLTVKNQNSYSYVDGVFKINLIDDYSSLSKFKIEELNWDDFFTETVMPGRNRVRIYDSDLTTPTIVGYEPYTPFGHILTVYIKIPLLVVGQAKTLYLAWDVVGLPGIENTDYQNVEHGEFFSIEDGTNYEKLFQSERVLSIDSEITMPCNIKTSSEYVLNRADANRNGVFGGTTNKPEWSNVAISKRLTDSTMLIGQPKSIQMGGSSGDSENTVEFDLSFDSLPEQLTIWGRIKYNQSDLAAKEGYYEKASHIICNLRRSTADDIEAMVFYILAQDKLFAVQIGETWWHFSNIDLVPITHYSSGGEQGDYFFLLSINRGIKMSLFTGSPTEGILYYEEIEWSEYTGGDETVKDEYYNDIDKFVLGFWDDIISTKRNMTMPNAHYDQWQMIKNRYYSAEDENDIRAVSNIADFMPGYDIPVGL